MSMWSTGIPGSSRFHSKPAFILRAIANDIFPALNVTDGSLGASTTTTQVRLCRLVSHYVPDTPTKAPLNDNTPGPHLCLTSISMWSAPDDIDNWAVGLRGADWLFVRNTTREFNHINSLSLIACGH
ncbi:hypothetical protein BKA82DRAFT_2018979 [Pisolithus tinctorius]|nr:hypothetical protein BKA82DRAFT_2018979 [Pisolithus tinctorius]